LRESLHAEMAKEVPDLTGLTEKAKAEIQDVSGVMQKNLDLFTAFYTSLDDNQKKQLMSEVKKRMADHSRRDTKTDR
jgi:hypothetical protein